METKRPFMTLSPRTIRNVVALVVFGGIGVWVVVTSIRKAEDPARMASKWAFTLIAFGFMLWVNNPLDSIVISLVFLFVWRGPIVALLAKPFGALYDGGEAAPIPHPTYSIAQSRQK